jgi:hypothetical protein
MRAALEAFARELNGGVIITASSPTVTHRDLLLSACLQFRLPTVSPFRFFTSSGGLASYGPNANIGYEHAATYVHRVLKGENPIVSSVLEKSLLSSGLAATTRAGPPFLCTSGGLRRVSFELATDGAE